MTESAKTNHELGRREPTVKCERDELQAHIPKSDVKTCRCPTGTNAGYVEGARHERFLVLGGVVLRLWVLMGI